MSDSANARAIRQPTISFTVCCHCMLIMHTQNTTILDIFSKNLDTILQIEKILWDALKMMSQETFIQSLKTLGMEILLIHALKTASKEVK